MQNNSACNFNLMNAFCRLKNPFIKILGADN
jgi:hypothetical protein